MDFILDSILFIIFLDSDAIWDPNLGKLVLKRELNTQSCTVRDVGTIWGYKKEFIGISWVISLVIKYIN